MISRRWSEKYDRCQKCGGVRLPHAARGLCLTCYKAHQRAVKAGYETRPIKPVAPTSYDQIRGFRRCAICGVFKHYGPGPNGEPSEFGVQGGFNKDGSRKGGGYRHECIPCRRKVERERHERRKQQSVMQEGG